MKKIALASGALIILLGTVSLLMALAPAKVNELKQKAQQAIKATQYAEAQKHIDALRTAKEFRVAEPLEIELLKSQLAAAQTKAPAQPEQAVAPKVQDDDLARLMAENEQLKSEITSLKEQPATPGASADALAALREQLKKANDELVSVKDQLRNAYSAEVVNHMQALAHELISATNMAGFKVGQAQTAVAAGQQEEATQAFKDAQTLLFDTTQGIKDELAQMVSGEQEESLSKRIQM